MIHCPLSKIKTLLLYLFESFATIFQLQSTIFHQKLLRNGLHPNQIYSLLPFLPPKMCLVKIHFLRTFFHVKDVKVMKNGRKLPMQWVEFWHS